MYRFFVSPDQIREKEIRITGADVNHIKNVLRMKKGEEIAVSNGVDPAEYRCLIREMLEDEIFCDIIFMKEEGVELPVSVTLYQGLPKSDKMVLLIKLTLDPIWGSFADRDVVFVQGQSWCIQEKHCCP